MKNEVGKETFITKCAHKNLLCDWWIIQHYSARHIIIKQYVQWYDIHVYWYTCIWTSVIMIERKEKKNGDFSSIQLLPFLPVSVCRTLHHFFFSVFIYNNKNMRNIFMDLSYPSNSKQLGKMLHWKLLPRHSWDTFI